MILYITRKFPPSVGGMQRFNAKLVENLKPMTELSVIAWGGEQAVLPFFLLFAFFKALYLCLKYPIQCIYVSDGLLSPLGYLLKKITRKPVAVSIHGRDIAFDLKIYQIVVPWALRHLDKVICVSAALKEECIKRKVPEHILTVIPNGVDVEDFNIHPEQSRIQILEKMIGQTIQGKKILLTVGRLVPKKGIDYFLLHIFPSLVKEENILYFIAGDGPLKESIQSIIKENKWDKRVFLLGKISMDDGLLQTVYQSAHLFVMPNIPVKNDMEGFGIVAIEASATGLPVIASNVDGIAEAVHPETGFLIPFQNYNEFLPIILRLLNNDSERVSLGKTAQQFVREHHSWQQIASQYLYQFRLLIPQPK